MNKSFLKLSVRQFQRFKSSKIPLVPPRNDSLPKSLKDELSIDTRTVEYEFPKSPKSNIPPHVLKNSNDNLLIRYRKYIPAAIALVLGAWGMYTIYYFTNPDASKNGQDLLSPDDFTEFFISNKRVIDKDHFIIELTPRTRSDILSKFINSKGYWDGSKIWNVEVKQPEIMVVRSYTPLPIVLAHPKEISDTPVAPVLRLINSETDVGKFCLYIKKYPNGEVAKWLSSRPIGSTIEIRGPFVEYKFPTEPIDRVKGFQRPRLLNLPSKVAADPFIDAFRPEGVPKPNNVVGFAAGTGIVPYLQIMLSPNNPFKGHLLLNYSFKNEKEIPEEFKRWMFFLEKMDRLTLNTFESSKKQHLSIKDIPKPKIVQDPRIKDPEIELEIIKNKLLELKKEQIRTGKEPSIKEIQSLQNKIKEIENTPKRTPTKLEENKISKDFKKPPVNYNNALHQGYKLRNEPKEDPVKALVCGPEDYVGYVSGYRISDTQQGVLGGLLKKKGWDETNVYKL